MAMDADAQHDPEYVKALEQQIQRIERENRRLKREVLTLSPNVKAEGHDTIRKTTSAKEQRSNDGGNAYTQPDELEDIDLDSVLEPECEDSWIYKCPVESGEESSMTLDEWLVDGLEDKPVTKDEEEAAIIRRDLSLLLITGSPNGSMSMSRISNTAMSPANGSNSSNSLHALSNSMSTFTPLNVAPGAQQPAPVATAMHAGAGASPILRAGPNTFRRTSSPASDQPLSRTSPEVAAASGTSGMRRSLSPRPGQNSQPTEAAAPGSSLGTHTTSTPARPASAPATKTQAAAAQQRRSLGGHTTAVTTAAAGHGELSQPRSSLPSSSTATVPAATAPAKTAAGSRLSTSNSRMTRPATSSAGSNTSSAASASSARSASAASARPTSGLRQPSAAASKPRASSGLPTATRPASQLPRSGLPQPAKSGLRAPRKVGGATGTSGPKGNDWSEGCY
eukprot:scpid76056/ scgid5301/ 